MPSGEVAHGILYGRNRQVLDLLSTGVPVTVVSGDSGVGITRVLEEVAAMFGGVARPRLRSGTRQRQCRLAGLTRWGLRPR